MSLNETNTTLYGSRGVDVYPGIANPTESSNSSNPYHTNFVNDPTTAERGAGAGNNFDGDKQAARTFKQTAGVIEGCPGIVEITNIDPLNENSNKDDGWVNARSGSTGSGIGTAASSAASTAVSTAATAATMATGATRMAYGHLAGDETAKQAGKEAIWGKQ